MADRVSKDQHPPPKSSLKPKDQREAIEQILRGLYGEVEKEKSFDWLVVPDTNTMPDSLLKDIHTKLSRLRGHSDFVTPRRHLNYDFYLPSRDLVIEYDERQHFTVQRAAALRLYPSKHALGFDRNDWIDVCDRIQAVDKSPVYRDEQRAFYDSMRDLLAAENGIRVIRLRHGFRDWTLPDAEEALKNLLEEL
jgi:very-short-patch-repair endonuclease